MKKINVFILSVGRRVELVQCFKKAAIKLKIDSNIIVGDYSKLAPALYFGDTHYLLPKIHSGQYVNEIINICNKEDVAIIIPTIDTELIMLAENKEEIEKQTNAKVMISSLSLVSLCRDKIKFQKNLESMGFDVPKLIEKNSDIEQYPLFIKPLDGSSSINAFKIQNEKELLFFRDYIEKPIIQECVVGVEYTIDAFIDFKGQIITIVPRERLATRAGEIAKGRIVKERNIIENVKLLIQALKPIGHITIQCIQSNDKIYYLEINPRFGGGAPMSIMAGADSCENIYRILNDECLSYHEDYEDHIYFLRYDSSMQLDGDTIDES